MTEAEYLEFEASSPDKHELVNGEVIAMAGVSLEHSRIQRNLLSGLTVRLRAGPCEPHGPDLRVHIEETGLYAYPDIVVYCGEPELTATNPPALLNPRVVVEVLSASTADYDRGAKAAHYRLRPSVQAILLVDSQRRHVQIQTANPDGTWTLAELTTGDVKIPALDLSIPFDEIYERVTFPAPAPAPARPRRRPGR
jgi:Uma2 family endonuclease